MDVKICPSKLDGEIAAVSSKAMAHRIFICAALCGEQTEVVLKDISKDIRATLDCLETLGANIQKNGEKYQVTPIPTPVAEYSELNCKESGSTLRFLLPVACALGAQPSFSGEGRLPERPIAELLNCLKGCTFSSERLPFDSFGRLKSGEYKIKGNVSSQYVSGLLFALPLLENDSRVIITTNIESKPYIKMTIGVLQMFGIAVEETDYGYFVRGNQRYISPRSVTVEGDYSNAAFFIGANAFGNRVRVTGLNSFSLQGDGVIKKLLLDFKASGTEIDASGIPDLVPILAVVACYASCRTVIKNAGRLRLKESDRLVALSDGLKNLGADIECTADGLVINGAGGLRGGIADSFNDHRIAMAFAMAGTMADNPVTVLNAQAVDKSYPNFFNDFRKLGGKADVV